MLLFTASSETSLLAERCSTPETAKPAANLEPTEVRASLDPDYNGRWAEGSPSPQALRPAAPLKVFTTHVQMSREFLGPARIVSLAPLWGASSKRPGGEHRIHCVARYPLTARKHLMGTFVPTRAALLAFTPRALHVVEGAPEWMPPISHRGRSNPFENKASCVWVARSPSLHRVKLVVQDGTRWSCDICWGMSRRLWLCMATSGPPVRPVAIWKMCKLT